MSDALIGQDDISNPLIPEIVSHSSVHQSERDSNYTSGTSEALTPATTPETAARSEDLASRSKRRIFSHVELLQTRRYMTRSMEWPRLDNIIGEAIIGQERYYYANFEGGIAYKVSHHLC